MSNLREKINQLHRLDALIRREATGSPEELAYRFNVSKPTIIRYIQLLKEEFNAPIKYCRDRNCYYYKEDYRLDLNNL